MNEIVNKFSLAVDKFMPEMRWKQPGFIYSACGSFAKNKERIQKFEEIGDSKYIYRNELDKGCSQHDMAYGDFKELIRITASDKVLEIRHLLLLKIQNMMNVKEDLLPWFINFLIKSQQLVVLETKSHKISN